MCHSKVAAGLIFSAVLAFAGSVHSQESLSAQAISSGTGGSNSLSVQGGWWNWEIEVKSRLGLYVALGAPVPVALFNNAATNANWTVPFGLRVGYQYEMWPRLKLRAAAHVAGTYSSENSCGCGHRETRSFFLAELGLRYESTSGFVAGLDVPLVAFDDAHELVRGRTEGVEFFPPPLSFAFSQLYVGYAWRW